MKENNQAISLNEESMEVIARGGLRREGLISEVEKEIALRILLELNGTPIIRATSILAFCQNALQYNKSNMSGHQ